LPINELVHWILHSRLSSFRIPSFAGKGLPERMRSTAFALLGLTAAAGLALVAIFAQPGFPLLEPAPLPEEPSPRQSIAQAEELTLDRKPSAFVPAVAPRAVAPPPASVGSPAHGSEGGPTGGDAGSGDEVAVQSPAPPVSTPETSGGGGGSGGGGAAAPAPGPVSTPVSSPKPVSPPPEAVASSPPSPEPAPGPGNSSSAAAAEHASERGVEASSSSGPPPASAASAPEPGNGNGLAKGHSK
jgi:hypothetical protein